MKDKELNLLSEYMDYYIECLGICIGGCFEDIVTTYDKDCNLVSSNKNLIFGMHNAKSFDEWKEGKV